MQYRLLSKDGTAGTQVSYWINRDAGDSARAVHAFADLWGPDNLSEQPWFFDTGTSSPTLGLLIVKQDRVLPGQVVKVYTNYSWAQDAAGNFYTSAAIPTLEPWTGSATMNETAQALDSHGNVTQTLTYDNTPAANWPPAQPLRQHNYGYLTDPNYTSKYIFNRPNSATVTGTVNGVSQPAYTLATNYYDAQSTCPGFSSTLGVVSGQREHDDANYGTGAVYRGNLAQSVTLSGTTCANYDMLGNSGQQQDTLGRTTTASYTSNYAAPASIAMPPYSNTTTWTTFLGLATSSDQNSAGTSVQYDQWGRPTQSTGVHGAKTTYAYTTSPPTVTATTDGHWTTTTFDGLGRTIKVQTGDGSGAKTEVDTVYGPSGLSPLGVVTQRSVPYTPGGTAAWTVYNHDGLGRTIGVVAPDAASTTTYSYLANTVTIADPSGAWRTFTMDALGNIVNVTEPNPAGGTFATSYTYTVLNQLTKVQQTRGTTTQTRTWTYNGSFLTQTTMPETGTVNYYYNPTGTLAYKIDAKNQKTAYTRDGLGRAIQIQHYPAGSQTPDACQTVLLQWDTNSPYVWGFNFGSMTGFLTEAVYSVGNCARNIEEIYQHDASGLVTAKQINLGTSTYTPQTRLGATFSYNDLGEMTAVSYPNSGPTYNYSYDTMGRLSGMTDQNNNPLVNGISYGPAGELLGMSYLGYNETRQYNGMKQLTRLTTGAGPGDHVDFGYSYAAGQNNGKISQMTDYVTGEQVSYQYDALLRLASAATTAGSTTTWGNTYGYDGFGNLTDQTLTKGTGFDVHVVVNAATNRLTSDAYDANGNDVTLGAYDIENRLAQAGGARYGYGPDGKRVWKAPDGNPGDEEFYFWAPNGQRLGTYKSTSPGVNGFTTASVNVYFGGRLIMAQGNAVLVDRLGSNVSNGKRYFPYGQEKPSATGNNVEKFTGYFRDGETGLDYAVSRYHQPGMGRFLTTDPLASSASARNPGSWNRYAYTGGDPINRTDPNGADWIYGYQGWCDTDDPNGWCFGNVYSFCGALADAGSEFGGECEDTDGGGDGGSGSNALDAPDPTNVGLIASVTVTADPLGDEGADPTGTGDPASIGSESSANVGATSGDSTSGVATQASMFPRPASAWQVVCQASPVARVIRSAETGALIGALRGGITGAVLGEGLGALPGAIVGGLFGAATGVISGGNIALVCSVAGAYGRR